VADLLKQALDPNNDLKSKKVDGGADIECSYKGSRVSYNDFIDIHEERGERLVKGKSLQRIRVFGGFGKGTIKKSYE